MLSQYDLDINNAADRTILTSQITSAGAGRFRNQLPYAGFNGTVAQSLRPFPQFTSGLGPLWAPQGKTWYDSLQAKVTQRVWHGLEAQYVFTWAKELQQGVEGGTVNDVFNRSTEQVDLGLRAAFGERYLASTTAFRLLRGTRSCRKSYATGLWAQP